MASVPRTQPLLIGSAGLTVIFLFWLPTDSAATCYPYTGYATCPCANGINWCFGNAPGLTCYTTCNEDKPTGTTASVYSDTVGWLNAQNTYAACSAIAVAFGSAATVVQLVVRLR